MKTLNKFEYHRPLAVTEVISLLGDCQERGKILAGGTDLISQMMDKVITPEHIIDLKDVKEISFIKWDKKDGLRIGASTTISEILNDDVIKNNYYSLHEAARSFGTTQVRNMATIGGNICRSSPSADMVPPLLIFDAQLVLMGPQGERIVPIDEFFTGPGNNVLNNEILIEIKLPKQDSEKGNAFAKIARTAEDLAKINCAVKAEVGDNGICHNVRVALGAVASTPVRAKKVEQALLGKALNSTTIRDAAEAVDGDITPITDVRSNIEYRKYVSKIMICRLLNEAQIRLGGKDGSI